ncbi:MAG: ImmA/IrrE family metallo-endopeptidase [Bacteroidales bacterium]
MSILTTVLQNFKSKSKRVNDKNMAKHILTPARMADLSAIAGFYTSEYCSPSGAIDPTVIATSQGIRCSLNDYGKAFDGLIENKNGRFHIFLNIADGGNLYHPRVRFSLAHELGHYVIGEHFRALSDPRLKPQPSFQNFNMDNKYEVEADYFASCLLMPEDRIKQDLYRRKFEFNLVDELARKYNVSLTAALLRFIGIGNYPIMVVCTRSSKVCWVRYTEDFPFRYLLTGADGSIPQFTSAGEYFYEGTKNFNKTEVVFAEDWFVLSYATDRRRKFNEYCIYYEPLEQVISVLWEY